MHVIYRKSNFFTKYLLLTVGIIWTIGGFIMLFISEGWDFWMGAFYVLLGVLSLYVHFKREKKDFLAWDDEKIIIQQPGDFPRQYKFSEMEKFSVSPRFLKFETNRGSKKIDLRYFNQQDVQLLRMSLA